MGVGGGADVPNVSEEEVLVKLNDVDSLDESVNQEVKIDDAVKMTTAQFQELNTFLSENLDGVDAALAGQMRGEILVILEEFTKENVEAKATELTQKLNSLRSQLSGSAPGSAPSATPGQLPAAPTGLGKYTVQAGDTLSMIVCREFNLSWVEQPKLTFAIIKMINDARGADKDPNFIYPEEVFDLGAVAQNWDQLSREYASSLDWYNSLDTTQGGGWHVSDQPGESFGGEVLAPVMDADIEDLEGAKNLPIGSTISKEKAIAVGIADADGNVKEEYKSSWITTPEGASKWNLEYIEGQELTVRDALNRKILIDQKFTEMADGSLEHEGLFIQYGWRFNRKKNTFTRVADAPYDPAKGAARRVGSKNKKYLYSLLGYNDLDFGDGEPEDKLRKISGEVEQADLSGFSHQERLFIGSTVTKYLANIEQNDVEKGHEKAPFKLDLEDGWLRFADWGSDDELRKFSDLDHGKKIEEAMNSKWREEVQKLSLRENAEHQAARLRFVTDTIQEFSSKETSYYDEPFGVLTFGSNKGVVFKKSWKRVESVVRKGDIQERFGDDVTQESLIDDLNKAWREAKGIPEPAPAPEPTPAPTPVPPPVPPLPMRPPTEEPEVEEVPGDTGKDAITVQQEEIHESLPEELREVLDPMQIEISAEGIGLSINSNEQYHLLYKSLSGNPEFAEKITYLRFFKVGNLNSEPRVFAFPNIKEVVFVGIDDLRSIKGLEMSPTLETIRISNCKRIEQHGVEGISALAKLPNLRSTNVLGLSYEYANDGRLGRLTPLQQATLAREVIPGMVELGKDGLQNALSEKIRCSDEGVCFADKDKQILSADGLKVLEGAGLSRADVISAWTAIAKDILAEM